jgi:hypothetical protein
MRPMISQPLRQGLTHPDPAVGAMASRRPKQASLLTESAVRANAAGIMRLLDWLEERLAAMEAEMKTPERPETRKKRPATVAAGGKR